MGGNGMNLLTSHTLEERLETIESLSGQFKDRAAENDEKGRFPFENIEDLKRIKYTLLTAPKEYGGEEISLHEFVRLQEAIAIGDGSTALSIGWHMGLIMHLAETRPWDPKLFEFICKEVTKGALLNTCATEAQTGSPTRGGKPTTIAQKSGDTWIINGRKTFSTMSPALDFFVETATIDETGEVGSFLIPRETKGLSVIETWDSIALRATGSHDVVLDRVEIPFEYMTEMMSANKKRPAGYLLHIPACYLGIAEAAKREAESFAKNYTPNSLNHPISELPTIRQKFGEIELKLMQSRHFLYSVAKMWDGGSEQERQLLGPELGAAKLTVTNQAIEVVDLAMRIVGARSLSQKSPLQRYYRDVRAGLHNPPMDDVTIMQLAFRGQAPFMR